MTTPPPSGEGETVEILESQSSAEPIYDAFISYSHTADRRLAPALRDGLHRFAKPWYRRRAMRVFQDTSNLESSPDLWATIQAALRRARALVLLASASSAMSQWVAREIQTWRQANRLPDGSLRPDRPILIVLTDGEIVWDHAAGDFDWTRTTAVPRALSGVFRAEPLWLDLRWAHTEDQLSLRDPRFRDAIASLVAAILHRSKDDLIGEDVRVWRRNRRIAWGAASMLMVLTLVAGGLGVVATRARNQAVAALETAEQALRESKANELLARSVQVRETDPELALRLGAAAVAINPTDDNRKELEKTLLDSRFDGSSSIVTDDEEIAFGGVAAVGSGGTRIVGGWWETLATQHDLTVWDASDPRNVAPVGSVPGLADEASLVRLSPDGTLVAIADDTTIALADVSDPADSHTLATLPDLEGVRAVAFSPDARLLAAVGDPNTAIAGPAPEVAGGWLRLWDIADPAQPVLLATRTELYDHDGVGFAANGRTLVVSGGAFTAVYDDDGNFIPEQSTPSGASLWDISNARQPVRNPTRLRLNSGGLAISPAGTLLALPSSGGDVVVLYDVADPMKPVRLGDGVPALGSASAAVQVVLSSDGRLLATTSKDTIANHPTYATQVWDVSDPATPVLVADLPRGEIHVVAMGFSSDGTALTTVDDNRLVTRWRTGARGIHTVAATEVLTPGVDIITGEDVLGLVTFTAVAVGPEGGLTATVDGSSGQVRLWDTHDPAHPVELSQFGADVESVAFSSDGTQLATGSVNYGGDEDEVTLWDISDPGAPVALSMMRTPHEVLTLAFHPRQPMLTVTALPEDVDGWLGAWDIADPTHPRAIDVPTDRLYPFQNVFSPDGSRLALGGTVWDVSAPGKLEPLTVGTTPDDAYLLPGVGPVVFNADATRLAMDSLSHLIQWDISDLSAPRQVWTTELDIAVRHWILTPDQSVLVGADGTGLLYAYDVSGATPVLLVTVQAPTDQLTDLVLSPDGGWFTYSGDEALTVMSLGDLSAIVTDPVGQACAAAGPLTPDQWGEQYVRIYPYEDLCA